MIGVDREELCCTRVSSEGCEVLRKEKEEKNSGGGIELFKRISTTTNEERGGKDAVVFLRSSSPAEDLDQTMMGDRYAYSHQERV